MNIPKLREYYKTSNTIKNYKEVCTILDMPIKGGRAKILQLEDLARYCKFTNDKHKFIFSEIYDEALEKIDHRKDLDKKGNNSKYVENIKALILHMLLKTDENGYRLTKVKLFELLGMVNELYAQDEHMKEYLPTIDNRIQLFDINHMYFRADNKLTKILFDSLNSLKRKYLIRYNEIDIIVRTMANFKESHLESTTEEDEILQSAKYNALADMNLESLMQVILKFKTKEYKSRVNKYLNKYGIKYTYKQIELFYIKKDLMRELSIMEIKTNRKELNEKIIEVINENAHKTYNKNIENYNDKLDAYIYEDVELEKVFRHKDDYLDIQMELVNYLLKIY